jgi:hypothetical protein
MGSAGRTPNARIAQSVADVMSSPSISVRLVVFDRWSDAGSACISVALTLGEAP